ENLGEGFGNYCLDSPAHKALGGVLARASAAEVAVGNEDCGALRLRPVEGMNLLVAIRVETLVEEGILAHPAERYFLEKAGRNYSVGVDVVAVNCDSLAPYCFYL